MNERWTVVFAEGVLADLQAQNISPLEWPLLEEWVRGLIPWLERHHDYRPEVFEVRTVSPSLLGTVFQGRLIALFTHRRTPYRTWRNLRLWPRERPEVVVTWLYLTPGVGPQGTLRN